MTHPFSDVDSHLDRVEPLDPQPDAVEHPPLDEMPPDLDDRGRLSLPILLQVISHPLTAIPLEPEEVLWRGAGEEHVAHAGLDREPPDVVHGLDPDHLPVDGRLRGHERVEDGAE